MGGRGKKWTWREGKRRKQDQVESSRTKGGEEGKRTRESLSSTASDFPTSSSTTRGITSEGRPLKRAGAWLRMSPESESISKATAFSSCSNRSQNESLVSFSYSPPPSRISNTHLAQIRAPSRLIKPLRRPVNLPPAWRKRRRRRIILRRRSTQWDQNVKLSGSTGRRSSAIEIGRFSSTWGTRRRTEALFPLS